MTLFFLALNGLIMLMFPLTVATFLARRYGAEWGLFGAGALTFVMAQILHIPFNRFVEARFLPAVGAGFSSELVLAATFYGLSSGLFEEVARYITYRFWRRDARSWKDGLMLGVGHGGIEALILGVLFVINMTLLIGMGQGYFASLIPDTEMAAIEAQLDALFALPGYALVLGGVERVFAVILHLGLSLMVLRAVRQRSLGWLLLAILWHAGFNGAALLVAALSSPLAVEALLGVFALASLLLIRHWRETPVVEDVVGRDMPQLVPLRMVSGEVKEKLDESRYL